MALKGDDKSGQRWHRVLLLSVFGLYIAILLLMLFGKSNYMRAVNFVPLYTIRGYLFRHMPMALSNLAGNVALFIPLGVYLPLFLRRQSPWLSLLWILLISTAVEAAQFLFRAGSADIDDVLLNVAGGLIGILLYKLLRRLRGEGTERAVALISLIAGLLFIAAALCLQSGVLGIKIRIL